MSDRGSTASVRVTRRVFLGSTAAFGGAVLIGCSTEGGTGAALHEHRRAAGARFFTEDERATVEAVVARIAPGSDEDPGAVQMGAVEYIDRKLAAYKAFAEPTFLAAPFVEVVESGPVDESDDALEVAADQLYRYGYQSGMLPQDLYRVGLPRLDEFAARYRGAPFRDLDEIAQDEVLSVLSESGSSAEGDSSAARSGSSSGQSSGDSAAAGELVEVARSVFGSIRPGEFFSTVRTDSIEGMFADPSYGGNRGMAGWLLIGYPGYQRSYSPQDMLVGARRKPQPLELLPAMNPDRGGHGHGQPALQQAMPGVKDG